jgi:hypothetical protein
MSKHISISPNEAADRLAIRELVEAYAHRLTQQENDHVCIRCIHEN